ncbi:MAG: radical SAM protein [Spirochaetaceae bacterium]|jgi:DNA repair photolyase|nr:radical SAM protein [Spirochaetaceae bacterium]
MVAINEIEVKNILTKTGVPAGDYVINPYIGCPHKCMYCYADFMKRFTTHKEKWGDFLDVKIYNKKMKLDTLNGRKVLFSTVTDAYNNYEQKYQVTRKLLEQFINTNIKISILTKSDLVLRDIDIFKQIPGITVGISLNTLDDTIRKKLEPRASSIEKRLNAIKTLYTEGIYTYIFLSPMFPGITDFKEIINRSRSYTNEFWFENLNLRGAFRFAVLEYIGKNHQELMPLYDEIYKWKNNEYWWILEKEIETFGIENKIKCVSYFYHEKIRKNNIARHSYT